MIWDTSDLTYGDLINISNDPEAFLNHQFGYTEWVPWTSEDLTAIIEQTATLQYVGAGGADLPPLPFPNNANMHLQFALGFDYFKMPPSLVGTEFEAKWAAAVKPGRYGHGLCVRVDAHDYFEDSVPTYFSTAVPGPGYFVNGDQMVAWAGNRLNYGGVDYPNGYDVILPFTQRMHIYQPAGQAWVLDTFYNYVDAQYNYLLLKDGMLWGINNFTHLLNPQVVNGDVQISAIPDTVATWYDLEFTQLPDTPLVPVGAPVLTSPTPRVPITFQVKVNGVVYYSDAGQSSEPANFGQHQLGYVSGQGALFIDNYYAAFMTVEGLPYLAQPTWIIETAEPTADACIGAWTGVDYETNTKFQGDYTNTIKFDNDDYLIQDVNNIVYTGSTVTDGLYSKFHYEMPLPYPGTALATYSVLLGGYFAPYGFPWTLQGKKAAETLRDINFPNLGVDNAPRYSHNDLYSAANVGLVINQRFPTASSKGVVQLGVDIKNYVII
jgi:hypothetical protein